jgi:hypothetical protein
MGEGHVPRVFICLLTLAYTTLVETQKASQNQQFIALVIIICPLVHPWTRGARGDML